MGIAVHPNFEINRWIFLFYTPSVSNSQNRVHRLSRFELDPNTFAVIKEKVLLRIEATTTDQWHSGGSMDFDAYGDLWIQVGDNVEADGNTSSRRSNAGWASGNTANLIGGVIRIHPDSSDVGYSIPRGNFGEYFAEQFPNNFGTSYMDTNRVRSQIYAKGQRSNFTSGSHPTEQVYVWGEINTGKMWDEINVVNAPVFGGWPIYQGNADTNRAGGSGNRYSYTFEETSDLTVTTDISQFVGNLNNQNPDYSSTVTTLPPIYNADLGGDVVDNIVYVSDVYYYGEQDSLWTNRTFPPHFHDTFLSGGGGSTNNNVRLESLAFSTDSSSVTAGVRQTNLSTFFAGNSSNSEEFEEMFRGFIPDINFGPDGALYILRRTDSDQYNSSTNEIRSRLYRVDYTGDCKDLAFFNQNRARVEQRGTERNNVSRYRFADPAFYPGVYFYNSYLFYFP